MGQKIRNCIVIFEDDIFGPSMPLGSDDEESFIGDLWTRGRKVSEYACAVEELDIDSVLEKYGNFEVRKRVDMHPLYSSKYDWHYLVIIHTRN